MDIQRMRYHELAKLRLAAQRRPAPLAPLAATNAKRPGTPGPGMSEQESDFLRRLREAGL